MASSLNATAPSPAAPAAGSPAPAAPGARAGPRFNHTALVTNLDLVILAVFAVIVLFTLPKAFARFSQGTEWFHGMFLRSIKTKPTRQEKNITITAPSRVHLDYATPAAAERELYYMNKEYEYYGSDEGHSDVGHLRRNKSSSSAHVNLLRNTSTSSGRVRRIEVKLPSHMRGWSAMLPWAAHILRTKVGAGLILGEAIIIVAYVAGLSYAAFYKSNPFTNPIRTGFLAVSQLPIVLALAAKNNIPGMLLGISYEHVRLDPKPDSLCPITTSL